MSDHDEIRSDMDYIMQRIWNNEVQRQAARPLIFQPPKLSDEELAARAAKREVDQAMLDGFMEHYKALVDEYGVSVAGGYGGEVFFIRGRASEAV